MSPKPKNTRMRRAAIATTGACTPALAHAQTAAAQTDMASLVTIVGTALVILLATVIGLSVVAKLLIITGVVSRDPTNRWEALAHGMANIVGRIRPHRSLRDRRNDRFPDRPERF